MKRLWRYTYRLLLLGLVYVLGLLSPIAYVEIMCQGSAAPETYEALLAPDFHRAETRTMMTYRNGTRMPMKIMLLRVESA